MSGSLQLSPELLQWAFVTCVTVRVTSVPFVTAVAFVTVVLQGGSPPSEAPSMAQRCSGHLPHVRGRFRPHRAPCSTAVTKMPQHNSHKAAARRRGVTLADRINVHISPQIDNQLASPVVCHAVAGNPHRRGCRVRAAPLRWGQLARNLVFGPIIRGVSCW